MTDMPSISMRKHIRWDDEAAGENTSTLVLTSRAKHYVDVRAYKSDDGTLSSYLVDTEATSQLEWAFAGISRSTPAQYEAGELKKPAHTVWSHWIDSKTLDEVKDEGDMYPQPDGTVLEKGAMAHPQTGLVTKYEELWKDEDAEVTGSDKKRVSTVFMVDNPTKETRGLAIRIGGWIQGVIRVGEQITVVRWQWCRQENTTGSWKKTMTIGSGVIPSDALFKGDVEVGERALVDGMKWTCIEAFLW